MGDEEVGLNHVDHESENVLHETISISESSDKEINLFSKGKKEKTKMAEKPRRRVWKKSTIDDLIDCICSNKYAKKKLIFTDGKASKNAEIYQKLISKVRKR